MATRHNARDSLPTSHVFITVARGRWTRTFTARAGLAFATALATPVLALWLLGSTLYLAFHDDLVASLMLRQRDMQYEYEDRIAALRTQAGRDATRLLMSQRSVEAKLDELSSRENELQKRSGIVSHLEERASRLLKSPSTHTIAGEIPPSTLGSLFDATAPQDTTAVARANHDRLGAKPRPEIANPRDPETDAKRPSIGGLPSVPERVSALSNGLDALSDVQDRKVVAIESRVRNAVSLYRDALASAGLSEQRLATRDSESASGGPFVPLTREDDGSPFARAAVGLQLTLSQAERLAASIAHVPFSKPLHGDPEITSPFGARIDPFLGRAAMHTGIDLLEQNGTEVQATAPGRVTIAGPASGYGTMVEIDHGAGLVTRYAHLSETDVVVGQSVRLGDMIGRVGATGRATGPHLHYETRIDGEAVDPLRFLIAGQRLLLDDKAL